MKKAIPAVSMIVAPDAISKTYEANRPMIANIALKITEWYNIFFNLVLKSSLTAAGIVNKAMTSIIPTILINITTVSAVKHIIIRFNLVEGIPDIDACSSSKDTARSSL